jgi:hypothetical protein
VEFDLETGDLSGLVAAPSGTFCALYDALDGEGDKVAEVLLLVTVRPTDTEDRL